MPLWRNWIAGVLCCAAAPADEVYRDPNRQFHIMIPGNYSVLSGSGREKNSDSYIPACSEQSEVCALYPKSRFTGTNFEAASVEITVLRSLSQQACEELPGNGNQQDAVRIGGVDFKHFVTNDAGLSHRLAQYRFVRSLDGSCFQVNLNIATTSYGVYGPGSIREFTTRDQTKVRSELLKIVRSLRLSQ